MAEQPDAFNALTQRIELFSQEVQYQNSRIAEDVARVNSQVEKLVSLERYTLEHQAQQEDHAELKVRVSDLEKARETTRHMILSSFLFPLIIGVTLYLLTTGKA